MWITLVRYVEDELILRAVEHIVHGDGGLHDTEVRTYVTADVAITIQDTITNLLSQLMELWHGKHLYILR